MRPSLALSSSLSYSVCVFVWVCLCVLRCLCVCVYVYVCIPINIVDAVDAVCVFVYVCVGRFCPLSCMYCQLTVVFLEHGFLFPLPSCLPLPSLLLHASLRAEYSIILERAKAFGCNMLHPLCTVETAKDQKLQLQLQLPCALPSVHCDCYCYCQMP